MSTAKDFLIKNGVLKKYKGDGGDVIVPEGVFAIGDNAFKDCEDLVSVVLPAGVTVIGDRAFAY